MAPSKRCMSSIILCLAPHISCATFHMPFSAICHCGISTYLFTKTVSCHSLASCHLAWISIFLLSIARNNVLCPHVHISMHLFGKGLEQRGHWCWTSSPIFTKVHWSIVIFKKLDFVMYLLLVQLNLMAWIDKLLNSEASPRFWQFVPIKFKCVMKWPICQYLVSQLTTSFSYWMNYRHDQSPKGSLKRAITAT